jgi:hypothetical protein
MSDDKHLWKYENLVHPSLVCFIACGIWLIARVSILLLPPAAPQRHVTWEPVPGDSICPTGLERWTHRVFTVMGGFMTGAGLLTILVAMNASAVRGKWTWIVLAVPGIHSRDYESFSSTRFQMAALIPSLLWDRIGVHQNEA